ncbi:MAG: EAL domain-containing protein [Nitrospirae bacterium]|nr:EAL domain-containing protein [Nitrospirota bacterium]
MKKSITKRRKRMESEELYRSVIEQASEGILLVSINNKKIIEGNAAFNNLLGYSSGEVVNMSLYDIIAEGRETIDLEVDRILREKRDIRLYHRDGSYVYAELSANSITYNDQDTMCLVVHDITERKRFEEQLMFQANHDSLTGLANKGLLEDRLSQATAYQKRKNNILAIMLLDLDRFKVINDTLGHPAGDILLQAVAERLKVSVRSYDTVARLGGDEFVIVVTDVLNTNDVITIAKNILNLFTTPFTLNGQELFVTASIGISVYPFDGDSVEHLLMKADTAMYHCKGQGGNNYQFFAEDMNIKVRDRLTLETSLRKAIDQEELILYYQPKVDLTTGRICGMEALIRWRRADGKLVLPAEFIPLAEETGLIIPIGEWVLRNACRDTRRLLDKGYSGLRVSVNLSGRQFAQQNLVEMLKDALTESGLDPGHLELELTESVLMKDEEGIIKKLCAMKETGVMLSIDDFGTGYSSLSYLKRFPIDEIKIDRSFVQDITNNPDGAAIVNAILAMAHTLKLRVVAEGVETMEQAMFLVEHRCEEMQGYYFSPPLPLEAFEEMLRSGKQLTVASQHI